MTSGSATAPAPAPTPSQPGNTAAPYNFLADFTNVNGKLYFEAYDTSTSKYMLGQATARRPAPGLVTELTNQQPTDLTALGSKLYFEMYDSTNSLYALWKSNGTSGGTTMVADIGTTGNPFLQPHGRLTANCISRSTTPRMPPTPAGPCGQQRHHRQRLQVQRQHRHRCSRTATRRWWS